MRDDASYALMLVETYAAGRKDRNPEGAKAICEAVVCVRDLLNAAHGLGIKPFKEGEDS